MTDPVFVDTNVVIYTRDQREPEKARHANQWIRALRDTGRLVISPQVVNEAYAMSTWKFAQVSRDDIRGWLRNYLGYCTAPLNAAVVADAFELERDFSLQWWDCLIVASALAANCAHVLSEDMQHGQVIRSAQVTNPFLSSPADLTSRR